MKTIYHCEERERLRELFRTAKWEPATCGIPEGAQGLAEVLALLSARAKAIEEALRGILEIGKRDLSNPKYDGYFETAHKALALKEEEDEEEDPKPKKNKPAKD